MPSKKALNVGVLADRTL